MGTRTTLTILYSSPRPHSSSASGCSISFQPGARSEMSSKSNVACGWNTERRSSFVRQSIHVNLVMDEILLSVIRKNSNHSSEIESNAVRNPAEGRKSGSLCAAAVQLSRAGVPTAGSGYVTLRVHTHKWRHWLLLGEVAWRVRVNDVSN